MLLVLRYANGEVRLNPIEFGPNQHLPMEITWDDGHNFKFVGMHRKTRSAFFLEVLSMDKNKIIECKHHICDCLREEMKQVGKSNMELQELGNVILDSVCENVADNNLKNKILTDAINSSPLALSAWRKLQNKETENAVDEPG